MNLGRKITFSDGQLLGTDVPSFLPRSRSIRAANTHFAPTDRWTLSWYSGGVSCTSSDWNMNPVCRRCVAAEKPAEIFFWAPSN